MTEPPPKSKGAAGRGAAQDLADDRRDTAWYIDKAVAVLVFVGGISAIIFI